DHAEPPTRPEQPLRLARKEALLRRVTDTLHRPDSVERASGKGCAGVVLLREGDAPGEVGLLREAPRALDLARYQGDADDLHAALTRQPQRAASDPTASVQHTLPWLDTYTVCQCAVHLA